MPKYLFIGRYSSQGSAGLMREGGSGRRRAAENVMKSVGGSLESIYWGFGEDDFYAIGDLPDNVAAAAAALTVTGSGSSSVRTVVLLTAEELDSAHDKRVDFRPPGS